MLTISQLKCKTCGVKCDWSDRDAIELAIHTCKTYGCGLKQNYEMICRMEEKKKGEPKEVPMVLQPKKTPVAQDVANVIKAVEKDMIDVDKLLEKMRNPNDNNDRCSWCKETGICSASACEYLITPVSNVKVTATDFEVEVDEISHIYISKNGTVEHKVAK